jgi:hypothetical protein
VARKRVDATLKSFGRWAPTARMLSGEPDADTRELRLLLDLLRDYVGVDDPASLRPGDIGELLLRVYPRKITVLDAEDIGGTIPAMRDLLAFLADTGAVTKEAAERLTRELDEVAPQFTSAVMDPENWRARLPRRWLRKGWTSVTRRRWTAGSRITTPGWAETRWVTRTRSVTSMSMTQKTWA